MICIKKIVSTFAVLALLTGVSYGQTTATQKFKVTVPSNISITAPGDVSLTHDQTDNDQSFPAQAWVVKGNTSAGVAVSFATATAFVHTVDSQFKRDATLGLALASNQGPAAWTISTASDSTDYANLDGVATVAASSDGVGSANFDLTVTFVTDGFGTFASGDYETTVTGTVTAN